ncbi:MAG: alpha-glucosidase/alpha-galactosidase, partial [Clostridiales bacterium]|nr:alpha-glucosidase/alpha-galactosidase [Clostridiales bacterium]
MLKIKIAYIGGGSRNWARVFMNDLTLDGELCGEIALYDIDADAALRNKKIGERLCALPEARSQWTYTVSENLDSALKGADFVVISILPGTFEDMRSDVHAPEKYGVYQSVGDTAGPGGVLRAMRTVPVFEYFADAVRRNCPDAWVINFTNPMSVCVKALYGAFPGIKAFGCCHEVFNAQKYLCAVYSDMTGKARPDRRELVTEVAGVNHFTFITKAHIGREDLLAMLPAFMEKYPDGYYIDNSAHSKEGKPFADRGLVKLDLFRRYGALGAAGDRHLVEFCNSAWYLKNPEYVGAYGVKLTPVDY